MGGRRRASSPVVLTLHQGIVNNPRAALAQPAGTDDLQRSVGVREDVLRSLGASKLDIPHKVGLPSSLPYFFASLKVAITLAFQRTPMSGGG